MTDAECIHGIPAVDCAICTAATGPARASTVDHTGHEKLLILCPTITEDSLLHFNRRAESYRLRAFAGRYAGRSAWTQPDAPTASDLLRRYPPIERIDVTAERVSLERTDRWADLVTAHNRRLGIGLR